MNRTDRGAQRKPYTRTSPANELVYVKSCKWCGRDFLASRPDAKYHTPACRSAASRARKEAREVAEKFEAAKNANAAARARALKLIEEDDQRKTNR